MAITTEKKQELVGKFKRGDKDTGSPEVQIAIFTERINYLTEHFKSNKKDNHSRRGLITIVNKRRKLLDYLKDRSPERYQAVIKSLKIRK